MVIGNQITTSPKHSASCTLPADSALVTGRLERFGGASPHRAKTGPIFRRVCLRVVMTVPAGPPDLILRRADPFGLQCAQPLVFVVRHLSFFTIVRPSPSRHSTVTDLARLRGLSTSYPLISAISMANSRKSFYRERINIKILVLSRKLHKEYSHVFLGASVIKTLSTAALNQAVDWACMEKLATGCLTLFHLPQILGPGENALPEQIG